MITFENVYKIYEGSQTPAVENLNLHIDKGEICVLVGASGCGKTTTMRMINKLINHTSGAIYVDGRDIEKVDPIELRLGIGYVIQEVGLFPHYTIEKNIATVPNERKWDKARVASRVSEMMEIMDLDPSEYAKKKPSMLSGGQRQRVGVARALAADPPIMLMDEPFGSLDPITRSKLQNELLRIQTQLKKTIVFVTHDIDEAVKMGDKIAVMQHGRIVQFSTPREILARPCNEFVENLVGQNRILKRFSLVGCRSVKTSSAVFRLDSQRQQIIEKIQNFSQQDAYPILGVLDEGDKPVGYIPMFKYEKNDPTSIEDRIVKRVHTISEESTLFEVVDLLFSAGERCVFRMDASGRSTGIITIADLFEAVRRDDQ